MSVWEKEPIPLFWYLEQPVDVFILKDKILSWFDHFGGIGQLNPTVSFNTLLQLFKHPFTKDQLPKELQIILEGIEPYPIIDSMYHHFAGTNDPHGYTSYLDLKMEIREEKEHPIILRDITFRDKPLEETLELSVQDAFHLIANTCASMRITRIQDVLRNSYEPCFHQLPKEKVSECVEQFMYHMYKKDKLLKDPDYRTKLVGGASLLGKYNIATIDKFTIEYLVHLDQQLQQKKMNYEKLLRLSGTRPLSFLLSDKEPYLDFIQKFFTQLTNVSELTSIQKLVYFTFLEVTKYDVKRDEACIELEPLFLKLYKEHSETRKQIQEQLKEFLPESMKRFMMRYPD